MIWPRHGRLSNCCSVSFRRAQRNLLNSRLQSKLFCCSHPRRWRKVRYIFTKSLILSTHVLFWFLFFVERTCLWGAYNMCFTLLQYSFNKPETRSPQDCDQLTENPIFSDSLIINSIHPKITLIIRCSIVCTKRLLSKRYFINTLKQTCNFCPKKCRFGSMCNPW